MKRIGIALLLIVVMVGAAVCLSAHNGQAQSRPMYSVDTGNKVIVVITYYPESSHPSINGGTDIFVTATALKRHHLSLHKAGDKVYVSVDQGFPVKAEYPKLYFAVKDIPTVDGVQWYPIGEVIQKLLPGWVISVVPIETIENIQGGLNH